MWSDNLKPGAANKAYAALVVILVWILSRFVGLEVPDEVAGALVVALVWAVPNRPVPQWPDVPEEDELP